MDGTESLINAVFEGDMAMVVGLLPKLTIEQINAKGSRGHNALYCAARQGREEIIKVLLNEKRIDLNVRDDKHGSTALHAASYVPYPNIVSLLLSAGSDTTITNNALGNNKGLTAFSEARGKATEVWKIFESSGVKGLKKKGYPVISSEKSALSSIISTSNSALLKVNQFGNNTFKLGTPRKSTNPKTSPKISKTTSSLELETFSQVMEEISTKEGEFEFAEFPEIKPKFDSELSKSTENSSPVITTFIANNNNSRPGSHRTSFESRNNPATFKFTPSPSAMSNKKRKETTLRLSRHSNEEVTDDESSEFEFSEVNASNLVSESPRVGDEDLTPFCFFEDLEPITIMYTNKPFEILYSKEEFVQNLREYLYHYQDLKAELKSYDIQKLSLSRKNAKNDSQDKMEMNKRIVDYYTSGDSILIQVEH